jgi:hypothetical protein
VVDCAALAKALYDDSAPSRFELPPENRTVTEATI